MDLFLSILKSVIYGVIEGITEWKASPNGCRFPAPGI